MDDRNIFLCLFFVCCCFYCSTVSVIGGVTFDKYTVTLLSLINKCVLVNDR